MKRKPYRLAAAGGFAGVALLIATACWWARRPGGDVSAEKPAGLVAEAERQDVFPRTVRQEGISASSDSRSEKAVTRGITEKMAALRTKLREWREAETGDDAAQGRIVDEWLALLDDATAGETVLALPEEDLATPLGVAAFDRWLKAEPEDALAWIQVRGRASEGETLLVVQALLDAPERLAAFCGKLPAGEWKQTFLAMAGLQAVAKNPSLVLEIARRMEAGDAQTNVLQTFAYDWMMRDPGAATEWLLTVGDPALKEKLFSAGAKAIAVTDPDLAVRWMSAGIKTAPAFVDTALCVLEIWAERDPVKAGGWVAQFPPGQARDEAVALMGRRWWQADPVAAKAWINRLPEGAGVLARIEAEEAARAVERDAD